MEPLEIHQSSHHQSPIAKKEGTVPVITLADHPMWSLYFHPEAGVVHHRIKGAIRGKEFRDMLNQGADCLEKRQLSKWLSDDRESTVIAPDDNEWGDKFWAPRVIKAGFRFWAIVVPKNAIGSMQMKRLAKEYRERGVTVSAFADLETALSWLGSQG